MKNGLYDNLEIIDASEKFYLVKRAKKLHGVGLFWGYSIFFNQNIVLELEFDSHIKNISLSELKLKIKKVIKKDKHLWASGRSIKELFGIIDNSDSIELLIYRIGHIVNAQYDV